MRAVRPRVQKKTPAQMEMRKSRAKRKYTTKQMAKQTGQPVRWKDRRLVFVNSGRPVDARAA